MSEGCFVFQGGEGAGRGGTSEGTSKASVQPLTSSWPPAEVNPCISSQFGPMTVVYIVEGEAGGVRGTETCTSSLSFVTYCKVTTDKSFHL